MKSILSISDIGTIRVCDIPLMAHISYAKQIFRGYDIQESNNGIYVRDVSYENLPKLDIFYRKNSEDRITEIRLSHYPLGQKECNVAYAFFKNKLKPLNVISKNRIEVGTTLTFSNLIHTVNLLKQGGLGSDKNKYSFLVTITGRLIGSDSIKPEINEQQKNNSIKDLYLNESNYNLRKDECFYTKINLYKVIKIILTVLALMLFYLYILNGRYVQSHSVLIDKWTGKAELIEFPK